MTDPEQPLSGQFRFAGKLSGGPVYEGLILADNEETGVCYLGEAEDLVTVQVAELFRHFETSSPVAETLVEY
jgi:hypothetical protein